MTDEVGSGNVATVFADPAQFALRLSEVIAERQADGRALAVLVVDFGFVGRVDATWGYPAGDAIRQHIVNMLCNEVLRPNDFMGTLGRDELAFVLSTVEGLPVALLAAGKSLRTLTSPFWIGDEEIYATPAVGVALFPLHGEQSGTLLQRAKNACSLARSDPQRIAGYDPEYDLLAESNLLAENRLRTAIAENRLELMFQPQYDLRLGPIMGAEAILAVANPAVALIEAEKAYAAAEGLGRISDLLSSTLNRALRNVSDFRYSAGLDLRIYLRLPSMALRTVELVDVIQQSLSTWSRRPGTLVLGISQTSALLGDEAALDTLRKIKEIGVKLAIDDPFTRISSLFRLVELPFQEIRIDVSGVGNPDSAPKSERILKAVIDLAHQVRLGVLAVGVPDDAAAERLKALGCDYLQAEFRAPAVDPLAFVERYGVGDR